MMTEKLELTPANDPPKLYLDGDIYPFPWNRIAATEPPDTTGLPSMDYALYLFHIVRFHLARTYRFFDEDSFIAHLHNYYNSRSVEKATEPRFWFVQFLLVIALGNAFLSRPRNQPDPPGSKYFARAMSAMPNHTSTGKDSLLAIETLALAGLYLYSIDHREAAHVQVSMIHAVCQDSLTYAAVDCRLVTLSALHRWRVYILSSLKRISGLRQSRDAAISGGLCTSWTDTFLHRWVCQ